MSGHSQTVFLVEQLQPDWLLKPWQVWCYLFASRVLQAVIVTSAILAGFGAWDMIPLGAGVAALVVLLPATAEGLLKSRRWAYYLFAACAIGGFVRYSPFQDAASLLVAPGVAAVIALRGGRPLDHDIQTTERLSWSWKGFARGFLLIPLVPKREYGVFWVWLVGFAIALYDVRVLGFSLLMMVTANSAWGFLAATPSVVTAIFTATSARVVELKTRPNMGIRLSLRTSATIFVGTLVASGTAAFARDHLHMSTIDLYMAGSIANPLAWLLMLIGLFAAAWFGGLDVIAHYTLRVLLALLGHAPLNYPRFLDYASGDLHFLQKVGGGYAFMHRYLREYFASEEQMKEAALV
jgi:hypothetical protein